MPQEKKLFLKREVEIHDSKKQQINFERLLASPYGNAGQFSRDQIQVKATGRQTRAFRSTYKYDQKGQIKVETRIGTAHSS
jgi:hypothetical protein